MPGLIVAGGATGIDARTQDMRALADVLDGRGDVLREMAGRIGRIAIDETVLSTQLLSPLTGADVLGKVVLAELPPQGVLWIALEFEARAVFLRGAALLYETTEAQLAALGDLVEVIEGVVLINAGLLTASAVAVYWLLPDWVTEPLPDGLTQPYEDILADPGGFAQGLLYDHPWLTESIISGLPAFLSFPALRAGPLSLIPAIPASYDGILAAVILGGGLKGLLRTGTPALTPRSGPRRSGPADSTAAIFDNIAGMDHSDSQPSELRVTAYPDGSGGYTWLVEIPGTQQWDPQSTDNPSDLAGNLRSMAGNHNTAMERAVEKAVKDAATQLAADQGVAVATVMNSPVTLAGYSQGGIVAASIASDPNSNLNVTQVVTGGSPLGRHDIPEHVRVLSIEHDQDVVPKLDGGANPSTANHTTVHRDVDGAEEVAPGNLLDPHRPTLYRDTAAMLDASDDPAIRRALSELEEQFANASDGQVFEFEVTQHFGADGAPDDTQARPGR